MLRSKVNSLGNPCDQARLLYFAEWLRVALPLMQRCPAYVDASIRPSVRLSHILLGVSRRVLRHQPADLCDAGRRRRRSCMKYK